MGADTARQRVPTRLIVAALAAVCGASAHAAVPRPIVPDGDLLVGDRTGRLLLLDRDGKILRRLGRPLGRIAFQSIELARDRRHAYVSIYRSERPAQLYEVDLTGGSPRWMANAISPALSPDGRRLAYVATRAADGMVYREALVVRNLRTGRIRSIPLPPRVPMGTPPELVINWSPDGRRVAVFDGSRVRLVAVATARDVQSQPSVRGDGGAPSWTPWLAPVFLDPRTLVVLVDCCIRRQHLVAVDLRSGARRPFAELSSPIENVRRLKATLLLAVTAREELALVRRGRTRVISGRTAAATG
jgi:hypothetical protein